MSKSDCRSNFWGSFFFNWSTNIQGVMYETGLLAGGFITSDSGVQIFLIIAFVIIVGVIFHELIHGIFYVRNSKNGFKSIKFGMVVEKFYAYCESKEIIRTKQFIVGLVMPMFLLGITSAIISIIIGNAWVLLFGGFLHLLEAVIS